MDYFEKLSIYGKAILSADSISIAELLRLGISLIETNNVDSKIIEMREELRRQKKLERDLKSEIISLAQELLVSTSTMKRDFCNIYLILIAQENRLKVEKATSCIARLVNMKARLDNVLTNEILSKLSIEILLRSISNILADDIMEVGKTISKLKKLLHKYETRLNTISDDTPESEIDSILTNIIINSHKDLSKDLSDAATLVTESTMKNEAFEAIQFHLFDDSDLNEMGMSCLLTKESTKSQNLVAVTDPDTETDGNLFVAYVKPDDTANALQIIQEADERWKCEEEDEEILSTCEYDYIMSELKKAGVYFIDVSEYAADDTEE